MKEYVLKKVFITAILLLCFSVYAGAEEAKVRSFHLGFLHPNGVDLVGYTVEKKMRNNIYGFYTFGFPSLAAIGISYYRNYEGNGLSGTFGVGIGSVVYGSLVYQWKFGEMDYFKLGAGYTTSIVYSGVYPALSYEHRFNK